MVLYVYFLVDAGHQINMRFDTYLMFQFLHLHPPIKLKSIMVVYDRAFASSLGYCEFEPRSSHGHVSM